MEIAEIFRETLKHILKAESRGTQSRIADDLGIPRTAMNDFLGGRKPLSETKREQIANYLGYKYETFIAKGRNLLTGDTLGSIDFNQIRDENHQNKPIPIDIETRILNEALEETGIAISEAQKEAVVKILREEIRDSVKHAKDHVLNYLSLLDKEVANDGRSQG
jgi:transcriptional regulator with XRE-family HTH domain